MGRRTRPPLGRGVHGGAGRHITPDDGVGVDGPLWSPLMSGPETVPGGLKTEMETGGPETKAM